MEKKSKSKMEFGSKNPGQSGKLSKFKLESKDVNNKITEEDDTKKKKRHTKSNSNAEEFAFADSKPLEDKLHNFVNNYDGK